jgi:hypothetical protein
MGNGQLRDAPKRRVTEILGSPRGSKQTITQSHPPTQQESCQSATSQDSALRTTIVINKNIILNIWEFGRKHSTAGKKS